MARNREDNTTKVDRLEAERDTKIADLNKEKEAAFEQKLQAAIAAKQKQFASAKTESR